jgi:hypothetical protein
MGANGILSSVSGNVDTNMSEDQIQELIKNQLNKGGGWDVKSIAAIGTGDSQYCFSYAGTPLYVTQPNEQSIQIIQNAIGKIKNGEVITDEDLAQ